MSKNTVPVISSRERALLVTVGVKGDAAVVSPEVSQAELVELAFSAGVDVAGKIIQNLNNPVPATYIGKGKLAEIIEMKSTTNYDVVIFDDELSPLQQKNLEDELKVKVIDRVALILDIFSKRARTREGKLQVELAQHQYLLPRLAGQWSHLERLGGGIGTRGPGESQLETDRRLIKKRIQKLEEQIEKIRDQRYLNRQNRIRSGIPVVALVGYTNAGKSTLLNALSQAGVESENKVFTTLDPTTRRIRLHNDKTILLSDTVGFIRKLPPVIVSAFRATLEELAEADLLLNVVDFASPHAAEECQTVETILSDLKLDVKPRITVLNKIDKLLEKDKTWSEELALDYFYSMPRDDDKNTVFVSAAKKWGLTQLLTRTAEILAYKSGYHPSV
ncbi:MAG: GTPase HflX [Dehalococcoidales bacterium]|nr:GTPase HflX [Dehalococcoidales bacterium]